MNTHHLHRVIVMLAMAFALSGCRQPAPKPVLKHAIRIATGAAGGNFYPIGQALSESYRERLPDVETDVRSSSGALVNLEALARGDVDVAFSFADVAYGAYAGRGVDRADAFGRLRALTLLQLEPLQFVAAPGAAVHGIADLRGRKAMFGTASGGAATAELVLKAFGLNPEQVRADRRAADDKPIADVTSGKIAGMFALGRYPLKLVDAVARAGGRLTPVTGPPVDQLLREYPFFRPMIIPPNTYPGQSEAVQTIGVHGVLLCRSDLDDELVYRLTKALFDALADPASPSLLLQAVDVDLAAATPIPLHPGAARYYRERELLR